jgi:hypothetical protein
MNMNSYYMELRSLITGLLLWLIGTAAIRIDGQHLLSPHNPFRTVILYAVTFVLMGMLARRIFSKLAPEKNSWPAAATLLMLPTLVLDPFSCAFFPNVFPNLDPSTAGIFGGWMLICCGGAVAGAWVKR